MSSDFYRAFEDRYRGSRELITHRLQAYRPFIEPLKSLYPECTALDVGCGRGEWLELLQSMGVQAKGVDLDEGMLKACHDIGLQVEQGDALVYLARLPAESQVIVSAFHVVEHIDFDQLQLLTREALRVLKPGGLLILETPNPENLLVATKNFYLDPSHQRPIPSELLSFVVEHAGFSRVKTLGLQESPALTSKTDVSMQDVFAGVSPDYAVISQKQAPQELLESFAAVFDKNYGLSMDQLLTRWDKRVDDVIDVGARAHARAENAQACAEKAQEQAEQAQEQVLQAIAYAKQVQALAEQAHAQAHERTLQLMAVYASRSWRITKPLRVINQVRKGDLTSVKNAASRVKTFLAGFALLKWFYHLVKAPTQSLIRWIFDGPRLPASLRERQKNKTSTIGQKFLTEGYRHHADPQGKRQVEDIVTLIQSELSQSKQDQ